ncbi:unnamed protein product [Caenorhabditis sp. 36 PRJEB53466]|nr:unnamed protein product [Caenorhabditis sp. 36 PRJEB53466]
MMLKPLLLLPFLIVPCMATYSTCSTNTSCPSGGLWSEWVTTDNCSTSCGSCSSLYHTRTCLSENANCSCSGNSSVYLLCNTQACVSPAQRTCCLPHVSMILNSSFQCGPLLQDTSSSTTSCCPSSGIWSDWSGYTRNDNDTAWIKTRSCLSEDAGCNCTGDSTYTQTACPCRAMTDVASLCQGSYQYYAQNGTIDDDTCVYTAYLWSLNGTTRPCTTNGNYFTPVIRYTNPSNASACLEDRPLDCDSTDNTDGYMTTTFTCLECCLYNVEDRPDTEMKFEFQEKMLRLPICFLLAVFVTTPGHAALEACASGVTCPTGGIWSEWASTHNCSMSCGSCASQFWTRECLSTSASCACTGDTSRYKLCNTQTCTYPAQRTCCAPYLPMLLNGSMQCGPLPKNTDTTTSCCPVGGLWSAWSDFGRNDNNTLWVKTRSCVSENAGCPCTGDSLQTSEACPCRAMIDVTSIVKGSLSPYAQNYTIDDATCLYTATAVYTGAACTSSAGSIYQVPLVRYTKPSDPNTKQELRNWNCAASDIAGNNMYYFYCDMTVLYWKEMATQNYVNGWIQLY